MCFGVIYFRYLPAKTRNMTTKQQSPLDADRWKHFQTRVLLWSTRGYLSRRPLFLSAALCYWRPRNVIFARPEERAKTEQIITYRQTIIPGWSFSWCLVVIKVLCGTSNSLARCTWNTEFFCIKDLLVTYSIVFKTNEVTRFLKRVRTLNGRETSKSNSFLSVWLSKVSNFISTRVDEAD